MKKTIEILKLIGMAVEVAEVIAKVVKKTTK